MSKTIEVDRAKCKVIENLGYQPSAGKFAKIVEIDGKEVVVVKCGKTYRQWTAEDRVSPSGPYQGMSNEKF